jgi:hypothetical protein
VGNEAGVPVGPLTVVSTHAVIDAPKGGGRKGINQLLSECGAAYETSAAA